MELPSGTSYAGWNSFNDGAPAEGRDRRALRCLPFSGARATNTATLPAGAGPQPSDDIIADHNGLRSGARGDRGAAQSVRPHKHRDSDLGEAGDRLFRYGCRRTIDQPIDLARVIRER